MAITVSATSHSVNCIAKASDDSGKRGEVSLNPVLRFLTPKATSR